MLARRLRMLAGTMLLLVLAVPAAVPPVAAADCVLSAPAYVNVGTELTIEGTGFPASTSVDIELAIDGGGSDAFSVQSDAAGALRIVLVPEDIDIGATTVNAEAGAACSASVTYTVLAAGATPPPTTPEPADAGGTGGEAEAPRTDAMLDVDPAGPTRSLAMGLFMVAIGGVGLLLARPLRRR